MIIRNAIAKDLKRITEIYNDAVVNTVSTFDIYPRTDDESKKWFEEHSGKYRILSAVEGDHLIGWASLSKWNERPAYEKTAENSVFVDINYRGKGTGKILLQNLITEAKSEGFHTVIARIATSNTVSIKLHYSAGFESIGVMKEVGFKFGGYIDTELFQIIL